MSKREKDKSPARTEHSDEGTKGRIVRSATKLFAARGFEGTSVKEISSAAKVNIAAINYHFGTKEKLYRHILESFGDMRLQISQRILDTPSTVDELKVRLEMFMEQYVDSLLQQPDICRMVQREAERLHSWTDDLFRGTFLRIFETLAVFLSGAKKRSLIEKSIDPRIAARMLFNHLTNQVRVENVNKKYFGFSLRNEAQRKAWVRQTLQIYLHGVASHDE